LFKENEIDETAAKAMVLKSGNFAAMILHRTQMHHSGISLGVELQTKVCNLGVKLMPAGLPSFGKPSPSFFWAIELEHRRLGAPQIKKV